MLNQYSQWHIFLEGHAYHWLGLWARYHPSGELMESYPSERIFVLNSNQTVAHQTNIHHRISGILINEWDLQREADWSLYHPHCQTMCNFYLSDETVFWVPLKSAEEFFGIEIIFNWETSRVSVFATYDGDRQLIKFTLVREHRKGAPSIWSDDLAVGDRASVAQLMTAPSILGKFGRGEIPIEQNTTEWPTGPGRSIIYFPDQIAFNVPTHLDPANPSDLVVDWVTPAGTAERRIVRYQQDEEIPLFYVQKEKGFA